MRDLFVPFKKEDGDTGPHQGKKGDDLKQKPKVAVVQYEPSQNPSGKQGETHTDRRINRHGQASTGGGSGLCNQSHHTQMVDSETETVQYLD